MSTRKSKLDDAQRAWVRDWWQGLQPREQTSAPLSPILVGLDRGARAALRRGTDGDDLLMEPSTYLLARRLIAMDSHRQWRYFDDEAVSHLWIALVAGVLSHVRTNEADGLSLAKRLGRASGRDQPPMSELRFRRMLKAEHEVDLLRQWRRAVKLAGAEVDVAQLANDLLSWQIEQARPAVRASDGVKFRWAYDYYLTKREQAAAGEPASIEELNA